MLLMFAIRDSKVGAYMYEKFYRSRGEAIRSLTLAAKDAQSMLSMCPSDYALYEIGSFDDQSGKFIPNDAPEFVVNAADLVEKTGELSVPKDAVKLSKVGN